MDIETIATILTCIVLLVGIPFAFRSILHPEKRWRFFLIYVISTLLACGADYLEHTYLDPMLGSGIDEFFGAYLFFPNVFVLYLIISFIFPSKRKPHYKDI